MSAKHFGDNVVLHTDGASAYAGACKALQAEGFVVLHDSVVHSQGQYTAFGRHDVTTDVAWDSCEMVRGNNDKGERRIRHVKGTQKTEGLWRHLKHSRGGLPMEVGMDDRRLNVYVLALSWRLQCAGCPYREAQLMCRRFRELPMVTRVKA